MPHSGTARSLQLAKAANQARGRLTGLVKACPASQLSAFVSLDKGLASRQLFTLQDASGRSSSGKCSFISLLVWPASGGLRAIEQLSEEERPDVHLLLRLSV